MIAPPDRRFSARTSTSSPPSARSHDIPEAATLLDARTGRCCARRLGQMWQSELGLRGRNRRPRCRTPTARSISSRRCSRPTASTCPGSARTCRRSTKPGWAAPATVWHRAPTRCARRSSSRRSARALARAGRHGYRSLDPTLLQRLRAALAAQSGRAADPLVLQGARRRGAPAGLRDCRHALRAALWPLLDAPPAAVRAARARCGRRALSRRAARRGNRMIGASPPVLTGIALALAVLASWLRLMRRRTRGELAGTHLRFALRLLLQPALAARVLRPVSATRGAARASLLVFTRAPPTCQRDRMLPRIALPEAPSDIAAERVPIWPPRCAAIRRRHRCACVARPAGARHRGRARAPSSRAATRRLRAGRTPRPIAGDGQRLRPARARGRRPERAGEPARSGRRPSTRAPTPAAASRWRAPRAPPASPVSPCGSPPGWQRARAPAADPRGCARAAARPVLGGAPNAELKYLRRWASDSGAALRTRIGTGARMTLGDALPALDAAALGTVDWWCWTHAASLRWMRRRSRRWVRRWRGWACWSGSTRRPPRGRVRACATGALNSKAVPTPWPRTCRRATRRTPARCRC